MKPTNNKAALYFTLLGVIFAGPLIVAWLMFSFNSFIPEAIPNGHLIQPPLTLQKLSLVSAVPNNKLAKKTWRILYLNPNHCEQTCKDTLYKIRQIRTALGKESPRVDRIILTVAEQADPKLQGLIATKYRGTEHLVTKKQDLSQFLTPLSSKSVALSQGAIFIVDPLGNIMMSFPVDAKPRGIYSDLKQLLKASQIG